MATSLDIDSITQTMRVNINKDILQDIVKSPDVRLINLDNLTLLDIMKFIKLKHSMEFGRFGVYSEDTLVIAAEWYLKTIKDLYNFLAQDNN